MKNKLESFFIGKGEVAGFLFTKVFENEKGYVYKVESGDSIHYESFFKKETPICIDFKNKIYSQSDTKEVYPKSNNFGIWAWCSCKLTSALKRIK
jgi:hypothetical protein